VISEADLKRNRINYFDFLKILLFSKILSQLKKYFCGRNLKELAINIDEKS